MRASDNRKVWIAYDVSDKLMNESNIPKEEVKRMVKAEMGIALGKKLAERIPDINVGINTFSAYVIQHEELDAFLDYFRPKEEQK